MKLKILTLLLLVMLPFALSAKECEELELVSSGCTISVLTINDTNSQVFTGSVCNITTYNPSNAVDDNEVTMTSASNGWHNFTFSKSTEGIWRTLVKCQNLGTYGSYGQTITVTPATYAKSDDLVAIGDDVNTTIANQNTISNQIISVNNSIIAINASLPTAIDLYLNNSHSNGNWSNANPTIILTAANVEQIANATLYTNLTAYRNLPQTLAYYVFRIYSNP